MICFSYVMELIQKVQQVPHSAVPVVMTSSAILEAKKNVSIMVLLGTFPNVTNHKADTFRHF